MRRKMLLALVVALIPLFGCSALNSAAKLQKYAIGKDSVASVNAIVGRRDVIRVYTSPVNEGVLVKEYTYASDTVEEDLERYLRYLLGEGFVVLVDEGLSELGVVQLGRRSVDEGKILVVGIERDQFEYTVTISKGYGTLEQGAFLACLQI